MSFLPPSRTKRRLLQVASLGLAGLLAGLFAGCTDSPQTTANLHYAPDSNDTLTDASSLPRSIEATQIPSLRHPPSSRRLQVGSVHTSAQAMLPTSRTGY